MDTESKVRQSDFAALVGCHQSTVSRLLRDGVLARGAPLRAWLRSYIASLEAEKDALSGGGSDDSAEAREARLALTKATARLRQSQERAITRAYRADMEAFIRRALSGIQHVLYRTIPNGTIPRLSRIVPLTPEQAEGVVEAFQAVIEEACDRAQAEGLSFSGFMRESGSEIVEILGGDEAKNAAE